MLERTEIAQDVTLHFTQPVNVADLEWRMALKVLAHVIVVSRRDDLGGLRSGVVSLLGRVAPVNRAGIEGSGREVIRPGQWVVAICSSPLVDGCEEGNAIGERGAIGATGIAALRSIVTGISRSCSFRLWCGCGRWGGRRSIGVLDICRYWSNVVRIIRIVLDVFDNSDLPLFHWRKRHHGLEVVGTIGIFPDVDGIWDSF